MSLVALMGVLLAGCAGSRPYAARTGPWSAALSSDTPGSLFPADEVVMTDAEIRAVLDAEIALPPSSTVAILDFTGSAGAGRMWSSDTAQLYDSTLDGLERRLAACTAVERVAVMPAMMAPQIRTVPHMRAAAARFRADLLLLYQTTVHTYDRERLLGRHQAKARCTVEAVLLDVRSGVVVFSAQASSDFTAEKTRDDFDLTETRNKARARAFGEALTELGGDLVAFFN